MEQIEIAAPEGWSLERGPESVVTLAAPEGDVRIACLEMEPHADARATAHAAWRMIEPTFASEVLREIEFPMGNWDDARQIYYQTAAREARIELAVVRRLGARAFVNLVRGTTAGLSRRGAQLNEAIGAWKPMEYRESTVSDGAAARWGAGEIHKLEKFVRFAMAELKVPGVSIAIVRGGEVVCAEGFGVRSLEEPEPVTPRTRFMIGSTTKPLTTLLMAKLVDAGKVSWSTPVSELLPGFALADADVTARLQLRHTASASTGMPRQDTEFVFRYSGITPEDRMEQMKSMRPTTGFGETFQYSNLLVAAGGYAAGRAWCKDGGLEDAYEQAMRALVFEPLGMRDTFLRQEDALAGEAALPHAGNFEGGVSRIPLSMERTAYSVAPAGAAWSTALDLANYVMLELGKGMLPGGARVIGEQALLERREKGIKIDNKTSYGLGLIVGEAMGVRVIQHGGNTLGFTADLFFLPDHDLGAVVLTNVQAANLFTLAVQQKIFELALGADPRAEKTLGAGVKMRRDETALLHEKIVTDPAAIAWVGDLLGRYTSAELGSATLSRRDDGSYWMQFDEWGSAIGGQIQPAGDRLLRLLSPPWRGGLKLLVDAEGQRLLLDAGQQKYAFKRGTVPV